MNKKSLLLTAFGIIFEFTFDQDGNCTEIYQPRLDFICKIIGQARREYNNYVKVDFKDVYGQEYRLTQNKYGYEMGMPVKTYKFSTCTVMK